MKVLGIGEAVVDKISIAAGAEDGLPIKVAQAGHDAGGPVLSALILLAKLGVDCTMVASLGKDREGAFIKRVLQEENIALVEHTRQATKQHVIIVDAQTGQRQKFRGAVEHEPLEGLGAEYVSSFDMIIMDRHERTAFYEVVRHMDSKAQIIIDPSAEVSDFTMDMMRHASCPIIPIEALAELGRGKELDEALAAVYGICNKPFIVTLGELGSLIYDNGALELVAPLAVHAIDTLGAGDIYRGAFAYGQIQGWDLPRSASYANAAAALQCTRRGNAMAIPDKTAIEASMAAAPCRTVDVSLVATHFAGLSDGPAAAPEGQTPRNGAHKLETVAVG